MIIQNFHNRNIIKIFRCEQLDVIVKKMLYFKGLTIPVATFYSQTYIILYL